MYYVFSEKMIQMQFKKWKQFYDRSIVIPHKKKRWGIGVQPAKCLLICKFYCSHVFPKSETWWSVTFRIPF